MSGRVATVLQKENRLMMMVSIANICSWLWLLPLPNTYYVTSHSLSNTYAEWMGWHQKCSYRCRPNWMLISPPKDYISTWIKFLTSSVGRSSAVGDWCWNINARMMGIDVGNANVQVIMVAWLKKEKKISTSPGLKLIIAGTSKRQ